jgi:hypothetical protein
VCEDWIIVRNQLVGRKHRRIGRQRDEKENEEDGGVAVNKDTQIAGAN